MKAGNPSYVPFGKKMAYSLPAFALAMVGIPIYIYVPKFYTDTIGVPIGIIGSILLLIRIFDAVTDPMIGYLSDRTRSRFGRRRPYMGIGSLFLAGSILFLFNPPDLETFDAVVWLTVWMALLFLAWTVVAVPYESLGPELTPDYHERTALFAVRDGMLITGTIAAAALPAIIKWALAGRAEPADEPVVFFWMSVIYVPLVLLGVGYCLFAVQESFQSRFDQNRSGWRGFASVLQNRPFVILLAAYTLSAFGGQLPATLILYYVEYVLESSRADLFLFMYLATGILFLPAWIGISRRIGKKRAWILSLVINTGAFSGVFFLGAGDAFWYGFLVVLSGIGFGAGLALPSAIQADVIDYDELLTGNRREGQYIGIWSIAKKLSAAAGIGIGLWALGAAGYQPNIAQSDDVLLMLRTLYALVPCLCNLAALVLIGFYPITEESHRRIQDQLAAAGKQPQGVSS